MQYVIILNYETIKLTGNMGLTHSDQVNILLTSNNMANIFQNAHNRHPIPCLWAKNVWCFSWDKMAAI